MKSFTAKDMEALALTDKNAARLVAFFMATDEYMDNDSRVIMLRAALGFTEDEFERCLDVLQREGFGEIRWLN